MTIRGPWRSVTASPSGIGFKGHADDFAGRRLGRLRLISQPVEKSPPVSQLGFDPVLGHPTFEEFKDLLAKKKGTIKGVIMDQAFSAGVGNVSPALMTELFPAEPFSG